MQVAAVILAAGASTRFGTPKQLARLGDRTLLQMVIEVADQAGLRPIIAVVPPGLAVPPHVVPELNDAPGEGMSRSLRLGIAAVPAEVGAAVILLADQPTLTVSTIRAIVAAGIEHPVVAARAGGRLGPPVLLRRESFGLADEAVGDEGLRSILAGRPELVTAVDVAEHAPDVDTPEDLERLG